MPKKKPKYISTEEALAKLQRYCAYQDRCHQEVRTKLLDLGIYGDELEHIIVELIRENFLNEERFACSFARGKFRMKKWGRVRIQQELKKRNISAYCLRKGMEEIGEADYLNCLDSILDKKEATLHIKNEFKRNQHLARYAIQKGYESFLVWDRIKKRQSEN